MLLQTSSKLHDLKKLAFVRFGCESMTSLICCRRDLLALLPVEKMETHILGQMTSNAATKIATAVAKVLLPFDQGMN